MTRSVKLTAELVEAFAGTFLSPMYDQPQPTPDFHREAWNLYCSDWTQCAVAAPRNHAKSTGLTHDYGLAMGLFRNEDYIIILGATEEMAIEHLGDIAAELKGNDAIIKHFKIKQFLTEQKTDIIVEFSDGHQLRYIARGAEQKIRGKKWRGKRPGLILGDDIEDDEQVENKERRTKFWRWLIRAAKQALRDGGKIRIHGTILHEDSALAKIMKHRSWRVLKYKAHKGYDDFSDILWPEKFPESRLRSIRQEFIEAGDAPGYSQEYLNDPFDNENAYLRKDDFLEMTDEDYQADKNFSAGWDFAISKEDSANKTSVTVGGQDIKNYLHIVDNRHKRWDSLEIVDEMFSTQQAWNIDIHFVEKGQIWAGLKPIIEKEMLRRNIFLNIVELASTKDKAVRGRVLQKRHRARAMKFDKKAEWYPAYESQLLRFTGVSEALEDDDFDSTSILCRGLELGKDVDIEDFKTIEEEIFESEDPRRHLRGGDQSGHFPGAGRGGY